LHLEEIIQQYENQTRLTAPVSCNSD